MRMNWRDEHGVAGTIVALLIVVLLGGGAIAVDLGNLWATRRGVITATDAASLAAAQEYGLGGNGCGTTAPQYVTLNDAEATMTDCVVQRRSDAAGTVTVDAVSPVDFKFASIFGLGDRDAGSSTTASWGVPVSLVGLRPLGLCINHPEVQAWLDDPTGSYDALPILYSKELTGGGGCGGAPGNWGILDFNDGANSNNDTRDWIRNGYDGSVPFPGTIEGDTGAFGGSLADALYSISCLPGGSCLEFCLPIFSSLEGGPGANAEFVVPQPVRVRIDNFLVTGPEEARFLDLTFVEGVCEGEGTEGGPDSGVIVINICAVDNTDRSACLRDD